jgi:hypothetical protein
MQSKLQANKKDFFRLGVTLFILSVLLSGIATTPIAGQTDDTYDIDVDSSVPTSTQEVTIDRPGFGTYEIDSLGSYNAGDPIIADIATPDRIDPSSLEFQLYAQSGQLIADKKPDDTGRATFSGDTTKLSPGTYQLLAVSTSKVETLTPIVISGYDVSVAHPTTIEQNHLLSISGDIYKTEATEPPASVTVILWSDACDKRASADLNDDRYTADIPLTQVSPGEYNIYVTANGNEQFRGRDEIKSVVEGDTVTIAEEGIIDDASANFTVSGVIPDNTSVTAGDKITVTANIENVGNQQATQSVGFRIVTDRKNTSISNASASAVQEVTLNADSKKTITFENISTDSLATDEYVVGVFTANDSDRTTITVSEANDDSTSSSVEIVDPSIDPLEVTDQQGKHTFSFVARNVSADGTGEKFDDEFVVTFPEGVTLEGYSNASIESEFSDVEQNNNTLNFSVSPAGGGTTQVSVRMNVTLSPNTTSGG